MTPNYWTIPLAELRGLLTGLRHAGVHEVTTDSDGQIISEKDHHYLGCKRCLIEDIIQDREKASMATRSTAALRTNGKGQGNSEAL